jgi:hypothetical protein
VVERAVLEMMANLYGVPGPQACLSDDPLGGSPVGVTGGFTPAYPTSTGGGRDDPRAWRGRPIAGDRPMADRGRY